MEERVSFVGQVMHETRRASLCSECPAVAEALRDASEADGGMPIVPGAQSLQLSPAALSLLFVTLELGRRVKGLLAVQSIRALGAHAREDLCPGAVEPQISPLAQQAAQNFERIIGHPPELPDIICGLEARRYKVIADTLGDEFEV